MRYGKVKGRTLSHCGSVISICNDNPIINALTYYFEFDDGNFKECVANEISNKI